MNGTWVIFIVGPLFIGTLMGGMTFLGRAVFKPKTVAVFDHGVLVGRAYVPWQDLLSVECKRHRVEGHHGAANRYYTSWTFSNHDKSVIFLDTSGTTPDSDYINIGEFNQLLQNKIPHFSLKGSYF
jgi:hypothetical protein